MEIHCRLGARDGVVDREWWSSRIRIIIQIEAASTRAQVDWVIMILETETEGEPESARGGTDAAETPRAEYDGLGYRQVENRLRMGHIAIEWGLDGRPSQRGLWTIRD